MHVRGIKLEVVRQLDNAFAAELPKQAALLSAHKQAQGRHDTANAKIVPQIHTSLDINLIPLITMAFFPHLCEIAGVCSELLKSQA